jgi:hypothetical protein
MAVSPQHAGHSRGRLALRHEGLLLAVGERRASEGYRCASAVRPRGGAGSINGQSGGADSFHAHRQPRQTCRRGLQPRTHRARWTASTGCASAIDDLEAGLSEVAGGRRGTRRHQGADHVIQSSSARCSRALPRSRSGRDRAGTSGELGSGGGQYEGRFHVLRHCVMCTCVATSRG